MKIIRLPSQIKTLIFDIDSTLYTSASYAFEQVDCQVRHFAELKGLTAEQARKMISDYRKQYASEHDGKAVSLGNTLVNFGIPIEESIKWRKELLNPSDFLSKDEKLIKTLSALKEKYSLICVTNNPVLPAYKTLEALGIEKIIPDIVGLDTCCKSKPAREPFEKALEITQSAAENCVSIGDRYDLDLAIPLEMGMGGILVNGVSDVYKFSEIL